MKKLICSVVFLAAAVPAGWAASIFFQPQHSTINVGDPITIDVMASGVVAPWLGAYDMDISYDPAILHLSAVAWPDDFLGLSLRDAPFLTGGVNVAETSLASVADLEAAQSGHDPFRLFELVFSGALAPGVSPLNFDRILAGDGNGAPLGVQTAAGSVTVVGPGIPEPGTALLILVPVLAGLAVLRRRRRA